MNKLNNLEIIVKNLSRYASGDNAQPFFFKLDENLESIEVYHDANIAEHILNPRNYASLVSLGIIVQMMEELSYHFNFKQEFKLTIEITDLDRKSLIKWGVFKLDIPNIEFDDEEIFNCVTTNRNIYSDEEVTNSFTDKDIYIADKVSNKELHLILSAEALACKNYKIFNHIFHWVHLSQESYQKYRTGFHFSEINMSFLESPLAYFFKIPWMTKILISVPVARIITSQKTKSILNKTPNLIGIFATIKTPFDLINVGKKAYAVKFALAKKGYSTQPLTLTTFPFIFRKLDRELFGNTSLDEDIQKTFKEKFKHNNPDQQLVWIMRAGIPLIKLPLSLRKRNSQILIRTLME